MKRLARLLALICLSCLAANPAWAQSVLRDAETESLLTEMSRPLFIAAGLSPANTKVVLINDPSINAFVAGGQIVYLNTGLLDAADTANEVQGVIAHEIGHITGGHAAFQNDGGYGKVSILSLLLGAAAIAAGSPEAGMAVMGMGQTAAISKYLSFSRAQESSADAAGAKYLIAAGITGRGMLSFFDKLTDQMHRYGYYATKDNPEIDPFAMTHPMSADRVQNLKNDLEGAASWSKPADAALEARFKRVQAKLRGYVNDPQATLRRYPVRDQSMAAHYARAYAYHKLARPEDAQAETEALVKAAPDDPYFLEVHGQILLESGKPGEALAPLRKATERSNNQPLIATTFGHALLEADEKANLAEAEAVLKLAVARDNENPFAWFNLGRVYEYKGDEPRTALATAERAYLTGDVGVALMSSRVAMNGLPKGSTDWTRAQDVMMVSQTAFDEMKKKKRPQ